MRSRPGWSCSGPILPGTPGPEVLREIRRRAETAAIPVLLPTARREEHCPRGRAATRRGRPPHRASPHELVLRVAAVLRRSDSHLPQPPAEGRGPVPVQSRQLLEIAWEVTTRTGDMPVQRLHAEPGGDVEWIRTVRGFDCRFPSE